ncbi:MAG TPA: CheR family methyltransferase [Pseudoduganella sp.]
MGATDRLRRSTAPELEELELELLLEGLVRRYGHDFRLHERTQLKRKLYNLMQQRKLATLSQLQDRVLHDPATCSDLLRSLSVAPGGLFDDPHEAILMREAAQASLCATALPRVWLADCAGAGQAWTLAIILHELGLLARTEIHATVSSDELLDEAADASLPMEALAAAQQHYVQAGGKGDLSGYFTIHDGRAVLLPAMRCRISWAQYNLVTDASFNEFQMIACQRAMPAFGPLLRARVLNLFHESLSLFGVLGIDRALDETDALAADYQLLDPPHPWYKRIY